MTTSPKSLPHVARTAVITANQRAQESDRPDRLFDDPHAQAFVAAARTMSSETPAPSAPTPPADLAARFHSHLVVRTRFYDEYLLAAASAGCDQVVLLAAGLDTRAFRLDWPAGVRVFELDLPEMMEFKEHVLAGETATPRCSRTVVPADLRSGWTTELLAAGFRPSAPTAWLAEGLMIYLAHEEAEDLLTTIGDLSAPGSQLAFEHRTGDEDVVATLASKLPGAEALTRLWKGGLSGQAVEWLDEHGWRARLQARTALASAYGRPAEDRGGDAFVTAVRGR